MDLQVRTCHNKSSFSIIVSTPMFVQTLTQIGAGFKQNVVLYLLARIAPGVDSSRVILFRPDTLVSVVSLKSIQFLIFSFRFGDVSVSFTEIYMERVRDLLDASERSSQNLKVGSVHISLRLTPPPHKKSLVGTYTGAEIDRLET